MSFAQSLFKALAKSLRKKNFYIVKSLEYNNEVIGQLEPSIDNVRYATLQLCQREIMLNNVQGNVAELGVYKGDFAKRLNILFPNRKLYLFDTFKGFDRKDIEVEVAKNFSDGLQDFSGTSVELVMSKMKYPQNCIVRKGFFPETANGVEDTFCFVSLDTDLYEPILKGLEYFYPRLEKRGYIFIHDFNNNLYKGARDAVLDYCNENHISYLPIADSGGTAVITR